MGLLDDLLAGLDAPATAGRQTRQPMEQPAGGGMQSVMKALLPLVLAMLANRGGGQQAGMQRGAPSGGGGLGDLLGSILGGGAGASGMGGLGDLLQQVQRAGFGQQADSWVGRGQNQPLPPDAMEQIFGRKGMAEIARRAGVSEDEASRGMSSLLPEVVDRVTPDGKVPDLDSLSASVEALTRRYRG